MSEKQDINSSATDSGSDHQDLRCRKKYKKPELLYISYSDSKGMKNNDPVMAENTYGGVGPS